MRPSTRLSPRSIGIVCAKLLFGVGVFSSTVTAWAVLGNQRTLHQSLPDPGVDPGRCTIWFVGSSTIARWTTLARDMAPWDVHNRGVAGISLSELRVRFANEEQRSRPGAIVVYAGDNDVANGIPAEKVVAELAGFLGNAARRQPGVPVFVVGLKPSPARWAKRPEQLRFDAIVKGIAARRPDIHFLDTGDSLLRAGLPDRRLFVPDGVHLNALGYQLWGNELRSDLEADMPASLNDRCEPRRESHAVAKR